MLDAWSLVICVVLALKETIPHFAESDCTRRAGFAALSLDASVSGARASTLS
jgi:hypothetical protein